MESENINKNIPFIIDKISLRKTTKNILKNIKKYIEENQEYYENNINTLIDIRNITNKMIKKTKNKTYC